MDNNTRNTWIAVVVIVILIILGVWLWKANSVPSQPASSGSTMMLPYGTVTLGLGEQGVFQGITITPLSVVEDSRCNQGVQCVQAGTVRLNVRSDVAATSKSQQDIMKLASTTQVDTFSVSLVSVNPVPQAGNKINNKDYRFTFDVHESASGAGLQGKG